LPDAPICKRFAHRSLYDVCRNGGRYVSELVKMTGKGRHMMPHYRLLIWYYQSPEGGFRADCERKAEA
jgi:hypothetical protein